MSSIAVIGMQWGDEGKGKIVDWLSRDVAHVARFQGGHNAGHTVICGDKKTVLHLLPSGILHPAVRCYIGSGVVLSPPDLLAEIRLVEEQLGGALFGRLFVSASAALILPYHVKIDQARDSKNNIGTTKRGIGPAYEDKVGRRALRVYDLYNPASKNRLADNVAFYNDLLARHQQPPLDFDEVAEALTMQAEALRPYVCDDIGWRLSQAAAAGEHVLLEGAQGALLDIEQGTYPFVTSSSCLAAAAAGGLGADLSPEVLGITKSYCTRVGNGPFPTELNDDIGEQIANLGNEFGSTTGRPRRCGWLDMPFLRHALRINGCRRLVLTKLDILDEIKTIKICVAYDINGNRRDNPPADPALLAKCRPVYENIEGWLTSTADIKNKHDLPKAALRFLERVEELSSATIDIVSTGVERNSVIVNRAPFTE